MSGSLEAEKILSISNASLIVLHDLLNEMYLEEYNKPVALDEIQKLAFDELCAACEPENDISFAIDYEQHVQAARKFLKGRFKT